MKCNNIQKLIITDLIDNELNVDMKKEIESHIKVCRECSAYLKKVNQFAVQGLRNVSRENIPSDLWPSIKENIEKERKVGMFGKLKNIFSITSIPKLAVSFAALLIIAVSSYVIVSRDGNGYSANGEPAILALSYLEDEKENYEKESYIGFGSTIEDYFF
ncbi:hypothetical protein ACFL58_03965 [Elusimicrobiota bacterium]